MEYKLLPIGEIQFFVILQNVFFSITNIDYVLVWLNFHIATHFYSTSYRLKELWAVFFYRTSGFEFKNCHKSQTACQNLAKFMVEMARFLQCISVQWAIVPESPWQQHNTLNRICLNDMFAEKMNKLLLLLFLFLKKSSLLIF